MPLLGPPTHVPPLHSGQDWMPAMVLLGSCVLSPVRKISAESGSETVASPSQLLVPLASCATVSTTQALVGVLRALGMATGAPKEQPAVVHVRVLPVSEEGAASS